MSTAKPSTAVTASTAAGPDAAGKYMLRDGADVNLRFAQDLTSKTAADGDPVMLTLTDDLKVGDVVVARAGAKAVREVTNSKKSGMMGKAGELNLRLDYLKVGIRRFIYAERKGKRVKAEPPGQ